MGVIRSAAPLDPEIGALWSRIQSDFYDNQHPFVETLQAKSALRPGLDVARGTDILWTLNHPDVWLSSSASGAGSPEEWEQWFGDVTCAQLLAVRDSRR